MIPLTPERVNAMYADLPADERKELIRKTHDPMMAHYRNKPKASAKAPVLELSSEQQKTVRFWRYIAGIAVATVIALAIVIF